MFIAAKSLRVLAEFAMSHVSQAAMDQQIKLYQALADALPTESERIAAREISTALSRAAALQLDFKNQLFSSQDQGGANDGGQKDGDGYGGHRE